MCKNNSRESAYSGGFIPLQNCIDLIGLSPAIGYYSYTKRCLQWQRSQSATSELRRKLYTRFDTSHLLCSLDVDQSTRRWCAQALEKNLDRRCDRNPRAYAIVLCSKNVLGVIGLITDGIR